MDTPWITFEVDLTKMSPAFWMVLGEARSKCDHLAKVPMPPTYARELHEINLSKGVHATTAIEGNTLSEEDVAAILAASDIFVLPSYFEALPMSVIEAMLTGLPVVATNVRGPREQVIDGQTGRLVPLFDVPALTQALQTLTASPDRRAEMGAAGRARALDHYNEARVVTRTLDLLGL